MKNSKPTALIILDGFGYSNKTKYNAIYHAHPKNFNHWLETYPHTLLKASGKYVGLFDSLIGNSEVGHLTIGAGRIIKQPVTILINEIDSGEFFKNASLIKHFKELAESNSRLQLMGHFFLMLLYIAMKKFFMH